MAKHCWAHQQHHMPQAPEQQCGTRQWLETWLLPETKADKNTGKGTTSDRDLQILTAYKVDKKQTYPSSNLIFDSRIALQPLVDLFVQNCIVLNEQEESEDGCLKMANIKRENKTWSYRSWNHVLDIKTSKLPVWCCFPFCCQLHAQSEKKRTLTKSKNQSNRESDKKKHRYFRLSSLHIELQLLDSNMPPLGCGFLGLNITKKHEK